MADPAPLSVDTPNLLDLQFIIVTVRTDFRWENPDGSIDFHWITGGAGAHSAASDPGNGEPIFGATVDLMERNGGAVRDTALTDRNGQATLETSGLPDGTYTIKITPQHSRDHFAGPAVADPDTGTLPTRMYHPLEVTVKLSRGWIDLAVLEPNLKYASFGNRIQLKWPPPSLPTDHLPIDLKPIWMSETRSIYTRADDKIKMIVVHNTDGRIATGAINTFKSKWIGGAHYLIDLNGHVIKFYKDHEVVAHAGGKWKGADPNWTSIGIEIVHKEGSDEYKREQYPALLDLLDALIAAYPIDRTQIVGHSDVATRGTDAAHGKPIDLDLLEGGRDNDPGQVFKWDRLEDHGLGMIPGNVLLGNAYGNLLSDGISLMSGDNDHGHLFGAKTRPGTPGTPVKDLQNDLNEIGYSLHVNGVFDEYTVLAVKAFQRHFFSGSRNTHAADGVVDRETAQMIKNVKGGP